MTPFIDRVNQFHKERINMSDDQILLELATMDTLRDGEWLESKQNSDSDWDQVAVFLALSGHIAERKLLHSGVPLLLQKSCYGDPWERMRGLCHALEGAARDNLNALIPICRDALSFPEPGARLWAAFELMRFRDKDSIPLLEKLASDDPAALVREQAEWSIEHITEA